MNPRWLDESPYWAIAPERLDAILAAEPNLAASEELRAAARTAQPEQVGAVQVIPLFGVLQRRTTLLGSLMGATGLDEFVGRFRAALADPAVGAIVLYVDSPGGAVFGVPEAAEEVLAARGQKPVVALADGYMASAAYWIAAGADAIYAAPSADIGSIGVFGLHLDLSQALEKGGIRPTYTSSAPYKAEGAPELPLNDDARAYRQARVDELHRMFVKHVAKGRGVTPAAVDRDFGQGRMMSAADAVKHGLADRVGTLGDAIAWAAGKAGRPAGRRVLAMAWSCGVVPGHEHESSDDAQACIDAAVSAAQEPVGLPLVITRLAIERARLALRERA